MPGNNPKHGILRGHLLKLGQRRVLAYRHMLARARRSLIDVHFFQTHHLVASVAQHRLAFRRLYIAHPARFRPEHRHEVTLAVDGGHDERQIARAAGAPPRHFQRHQVIRRDAQRMDGCSTTIKKANHSIGPPSAIEPLLYCLFFD
jgi:hypothetical protein